MSESKPTPTEASFYLAEEELELVPIEPTEERKLREARERVERDQLFAQELPVIRLRVLKPD